MNARARSVLKSSVHDEPTFWEKVGSAFFFSFASVALIFVNKIVMTEYGFPHFDFLAACQFLATTVVLSVLIWFNFMEVPRLNREILHELLPITVFFLANVISGLGGTGKLNIPMFTALRRIGILMTMVGEYFVLNKVASNIVIVSVILMVFGALVAAANDLTFDLMGYILVTLNNIFTSGSSLFLTKASNGGKCSKNGVLFYNSLFGFIAMVLYFGIEHSYRWIGVFSFRVDPSSGSVVTESQLVSEHQNSILENVFALDLWSDPAFIAMFVAASFMGSVLNYAAFLNISTNGSLTAAVVGSLKNVVCTYAAMLTMSDYTFEFYNFMGLNIGIIGSLVYTYVTLFPPK
jgi:solute carrier family 35